MQPRFSPVRIWFCAPNLNPQLGGCYVIAKRQLKPKGRKGKNKVFVSGYTNDGKPVLGNIFVQCESRGVQLEFMIDSILNQGAYIDWILFYEDSLKAQWLPSTTIKKIQYALQETMGTEYTEQVIYRLKLYVLKRQQSIEEVDNNT